MNNVAKKTRLIDRRLMTTMKILNQSVRVQAHPSNLTKEPHSKSINGEVFLTAIYKDDSDIIKKRLLSLGCRFVQNNISLFEDILVDEKRLKSISRHFKPTLRKKQKRN